MAALVASEHRWVEAATGEDQEMTGLENFGISHNVITTPVLDRAISEVGDTLTLNGDRVA